MPQLRIVKDNMPKLYKGPHDLYIDLNGPITV